jgi:hypothetical protein
LTTSRSCASRRLPRLVLVAELGDLGVRPFVGERRAASFERLGCFAGPGEQLQIRVRRQLEREAAGEVIDEVALDAREERLVPDRGVDETVDGTRGCVGEQVTVVVIDGDCSAGVG